MATGQVGGPLHTLVVLESSEADLLNDLDDGQGLSPDQADQVAPYHRFSSLG